MSDVTQILSRIDQGDPHASAELLPLVYDELRKFASVRMVQERPGQTLQATALVHEAYLRLVSAEPSQQWNSRGHFFSAAAEAMRRILIDNARRKRALKRGGGEATLNVDSQEPEAPTIPDDIMALNEALQVLEEKDPLKAELVKLRCFAGLTMEQIAETLGISVATAHRHWNYARAWLHQEMLGISKTDGKS